MIETTGSNGALNVRQRDQANRPTILIDDCRAADAGKSSSLKQVWHVLSLA